VRDLATEQLAALVAAAPGPPMVKALGVAAEPVPRHCWRGATSRAGKWMAGIAFLLRHWSRRALVTVWVSSSAVEPQCHGDYSHVRALSLVGSVDTWPAMPPCYPNAGAEWMAVHVHAVRPNPDGRY
jgi:hypothetical protein